ncbi:M20/M25/M40 family metallo-hydrolase [Desulfogranum japonicum]|uniref:M20/M25/M40 family metallo-hydrolase n=1 Tax=Desulfogranum japonicum TaxID=231447 RepID=UPI000426AEC2|nr:M20/M25/M40 family metallo-hydrolase [Desulfogranum japonicum]
MEIDRERLAKNFIELCETDSPSRHEKQVSLLLKDIFTSLQADEILEDASNAITGSDCGNLVIRFAGSLDLDPIFFSCHMDTVEPARGVEVLRTGDVFTSKGETILGSDDKSGLAACIECMRVLKENNILHRPLEFVITTCEEIGLIGAKALDPAMIRAKEGYALDSTGFAKVITHAPALNRIDITLQGVAAHAGLHPEWGVNAITVAAKAIAVCPCGRLDDETTANIGTIQGGMASNIVPETVTIQAEVRSHNQQRLDAVTREITAAFEQTVATWKDHTGQAKGTPSVQIDVREDFPIMALEKESPVIQRVAKAAESLSMHLVYEKGGGGSDANIFNGHGLATAIIATGMTNVHSTNEQVELQDMVDLTRLLLAMATEQQS